MAGGAKLAVFDLDGTLADTLRVDHRCFVDAFRIEHGIDFTDDDWATYPSTTDSGIAPEVIERYFGRPASRDEVDRHKRRFIALLEQAVESEPDGLREVAGAADLLSALGDRPEWHAVVATGSWRDSALLKLRAAGLDRFELPLASADDAEAREGIVARGVSLAAGRGPFEGTVLIGDKPWDLAAADHFGFGFVGVGAARERLGVLGATRLFDDWRDTSMVLAAFEEQAARGSGRGGLSI